MKDKTYFNTVKNFRAHSVFQGKRKLLKNTECSLQSMFNTVKTFWANSVFRESESCSKF